MNGISPDDFVKETLENLQLLFPSNDSKTQKWLKEVERPGPRPIFDRGLRKVGYIVPKDPARRLSHFKYWGERLEALHQNVGLHTHSRFEFVKILRDRKDPNWLTAWAAVIAALLTVFFGLVQSIDGVIQVYKAYHQVSV